MRPALIDVRRKRCIAKTPTTPPVRWSDAICYVYVHRAILEACNLAVTELLHATLTPETQFSILYDKATSRNEAITKLLYCCKCTLTRKHIVGMRRNFQTRAARRLILILDSRSNAMDLVIVRF